MVAARVERVTDREAREKYGMNWPGELSGLLFPYFLPNSNGHHASARLRRDKPETDSDGKPKNKYVGVPGKHHLYLPPGTQELLADKSVTVCFVESEKAALALTAWTQRNGQKMLVAATGGVWGWRGVIGKKVNSKGKRVDEKGPLPDLELFREHPALILFDSNVAAREDLKKARAAFRSTLKKKGCSVRLLDLPAIDGVNGPDDFLALKGDAAVDELLNQKPADPVFSSSAEELDELIEELNQKFYVVGNYGGRCHVCWEEPSVIFPGTVEFGHQSFAEFIKRFGNKYILRDVSVAAATPEGWASKAITLYHELKADCIVAETNYGGAMVEAVLRAVDPDIPYRSVTATRGKLVRAEPVCAAFERGRAHLVGVFSELEQELCSYVPGGASPNRLDAAVWACVELGGDGGYGLIDYLRGLASGIFRVNDGEEPQAPVVSTDSVSSAEKPSLPAPPRPPARGQRGEYLAERDNGWKSAASRGVFGRFVK